MKTAIRWIGTVAIIFAAPAALVEVLFYWDKSATPAQEKVLVYLVAFQFTAMLALILEWRLERKQFVDSLISFVRSDIQHGIHGYMDQGIIQHFLNERNGSAVSAIFVRVAGILLQRLKDRPAELLNACAPFIDAEVTLALAHVDESLGAGAKVDISDHLRLTRYLCAQSSSYLQIQRKAFAVPDEWTAEWRGFLDDISKTQIKKTYILLAPVAEIEGEKAKIDSMRRYLRARNFRFGVCNFHTIADSIGGGTISGVIEVFGNGIIKVAELPEGKYVGGVRLNMTITDKVRGASVDKFAEMVEKFAEYN